MLRSLTEQLYIHLQPERVVARRLSGMIRQRISIEAMIAIEPGNDPSWLTTATALKVALQQSELPASRATVVLSSQLTRLRIAPWHWQLRENERIALIRHEFVKVYGASCRDSEITIGDGGLGKPGLACAVEPALMDAIAEACTACGIRNVSIKPHLTVVYNHWRKTLDSNGAWLVIREASMLTIVFVRNGIWHSIRSLPYEPESSPALETALAREALLLGIEASGFTVYFFCDTEAETKPELPVPFRIEILTPPLLPRWRTFDSGSLALTAAT